MEYIMKLLGNLDVTFAPVQVLKHREELDQYDSRGKFGQQIFLTASYRECAELILTRSL